MPARTSLTLHPPCHCASIVVTSTLRVNVSAGMKFSVSICVVLFMGVIVYTWSVLVYGGMGSCETPFPRSCL